MNTEAGMGAYSSPYEYAVKEAKSATLTLKKVSLIVSYVLWTLLLFFIGNATLLLIPCLALVPLTLWILVFLTWKYTQVEYEYSFFSGRLTVCRILGGRTRKKLCELTIRELSSVFPYTDDTLFRVEQFEPDETVIAASSLDVENLYVALWRDSDTDRRIALCLEVNEKALKILRYYNISALSK